MTMQEGKHRGQALDFFKRVHVSERKQLFQTLTQQRLPLVMKGDFDDLVVLQALRFEDENLFCATEYDLAKLKDDLSIILNFSVGEERYFCLTSLTIHNRVPCVNTNVDLFQLQRRQNIRFDVPEKYTASANVIAINGQALFLEARLLDISAGGCRVAVQKLEPTIQIGDKLQIVVHLGHRRPLPFQIDVRFAKIEGHEQILGLQYLGRDSIMENKLLSMMTDFQRELYMKFEKQG